MNVRHPMSVLNSFSIKSIFCLVLIFFYQKYIFKAILFSYDVIWLFRAVAYDILNNFLLLEPNEALGLRFLIN